MFDKIGTSLHFWDSDVSRNCCCAYDDAEIWWAGAIWVRKRNIVSKYKPEVEMSCQLAVAILNTVFWEYVGNGRSQWGTPILQLGLQFL